MIRFGLLRGTRGARNPYLQVVITHASHLLASIRFHRRKMSAHALLEMTRDLFRAMSLALRQKCPRNVEMKEAMAAFFVSDSVAISCHCKRSKIILAKVLT